MSDKKPTKELIESIKKEDKDFYRIEKTDYLTLNDPAWYDYYGISTFSSMAYENTSKFQRNFGLAGNNINSYYYRYFQTPIYNSIFNVKYIIGNHIDNNYYSYLDTNENIDLLLMERHLAKKARRASSKHHLHGPAKFTEADRQKFSAAFEMLITEVLGGM